MSSKEPRVRVGRAGCESGTARCRSIATSTGTVEDGKTYPRVPPLPCRRRSCRGPRGHERARVGYRRTIRAPDAHTRASSCVGSPYQRYPSIPHLAWVGLIGAREVTSAPAWATDVPFAPRMRTRGRPPSSEAPTTDIPASHPHLADGGLVGAREATSVPAWATMYRSRTGCHARASSCVGSPYHRSPDLPPTLPA